MSTKIFVGNFSFSVNEEKLKEFFGKVGEVASAKIMTEGPGGRSRGFGFVEFQSSGDAESAIKELNGTVWEGRVIKVSADRNADRSGGGSHHSLGTVTSVVRVPVVVPVIVMTSRVQLRWVTFGHSLLT